SVPAQRTSRQMAGIPIPESRTVRPGDLPSDFPRRGTDIWIRHSDVTSISSRSRSSQPRLLSQCLAARRHERLLRRAAALHLRLRLSGALLRQNSRRDSKLEISRDQSLRVRLSERSPPLWSSVPHKGGIGPAAEEAAP